MIESPSLFAPDLFNANEVLNLRRTDQDVANLAGLAWIFPLPPRAGHLQGSVAACTAVTRAVPGSRLWLLAGHTAVQPNSVVVRRRRLWMSLSTRGLSVPSQARTEEFEVVAGSGRRWFGGALLVGAGDLRLACAVIEDEQASAIVAIPQSAETHLTDLLGAGWSKERMQPAREIVAALDRWDGLLFFPVGEFDDRESGVVVVGRPDLVQAIRS
jgi:hypothetical protein